MRVRPWRKQLGTKTGETYLTAKFPGEWRDKNRLRIWRWTQKSHCRLQWATQTILRVQCAVHAGMPPCSLSHCSLTMTFYCSFTSSRSKAFLCSETLLYLNWWWCWWWWWRLLFNRSWDPWNSEVKQLYEREDMNTWKSPDKDIICILPEWRGWFLNILYVIQTTFLLLYLVPAFILERLYIWYGSNEIKREG